MKLQGVDFTGIAILGGAVLVAYVGYKAYKTLGSVPAALSSIPGKLAEKAREVGAAIEKASPIPFSADNARNIYDNSTGALDLNLGDTQIDPMIQAEWGNLDSLARWAALHNTDGYKAYADANPGVATASGMNFSAGNF